MDKLGVEEHSEVSVLGVHDEEFLRQLRVRTSAIVVGRIQKESDIIFYEANNKRELRKLKTLKRSLKSGGAIWVVSVKGGQATIRDVEVIAAARLAGLVDNKVVGFSETHTSLRLVIPVRGRES